ncbi:MAG: thioredoxin family protein [Candidatus Omnitrophota bacterium]
MPIRSIEVICRPCPKCKSLTEEIQQAIKQIEKIRKTTIIYEFKHTIDLRDITKYSLNPSQIPAILINGLVEFAGRVDPTLLKNRLERIHFSG